MLMNLMERIFGKCIQWKNYGYVRYAKRVFREMSKNQWKYCNWWNWTIETTLMSEYKYCVMEFIDWN